MNIRAKRKQNSKNSGNSQIVICGLKENLQAGDSVPGGSKRLFELSKGLKKSAHKIAIVNSLKDLLRVNKKTDKSKRYAVVFDERYLILGVFLKLWSFKLIFCPRGNKLTHFKYYYGPARLKLYRHIFTILYRFCDKLIFQTAAQHSEFKKTYGCNNAFAVIPNNVNTSWMNNLNSNISFPPYPELKKIGFLGGDNPRKGFKTLEECFRIKEIIDQDLTLLAGGYFSSIQNHNSNLKYCGQISDLKKFFSEIDLLVVPSEYDSFPNTFLEALAANKPVIISKNDISDEICHNLNSLTFINTPFELSRKITSLYTNKEEWEELIRDCRFLQNEYTFNWTQRFEEEILF